MVKAKPIDRDEIRASVGAIRAAVESLRFAAPERSSYWYGQIEAACDDITGAVPSHG